MRTLERTYDPAITPTLKKTIAAANATIGIDITETQITIRIDAAVSGGGDWICWPRSFAVPNGWGKPFTDQDGNPINEPMGTANNYEDFPYVKFGYADGVWSPQERAVEPKFAFGTDWRAPGLPLVTFDNVGNRYLPYKNIYPIDGPDYLGHSGRVVYAEERLLFDGKEPGSTMGSDVTVLGACIRVVDMQVPIVDPEDPDSNIFVPQRAVFLLMVVHDASETYRSYETWSAKVGTMGDDGVISWFPSEEVDGVANAGPIARDYWDDGFFTNPFFGGGSEAQARANSAFSSRIQVHTVMGTKDNRKWGNAHWMPWVDFATPQPESVYGKYGHSYYFNQSGTKCASVAMGHIFEFDWEFNSDAEFWGFTTTQNIELPFPPPGTTPGYRNAYVKPDPSTGLPSPFPAVSSYGNYPLGVGAAAFGSCFNPAGPGIVSTIISTFEGINGSTLCAQNDLQLWFKPNNDTLDAAQWCGNDTPFGRQQFDFAAGRIIELSKEDYYNIVTENYDPAYNGEYAIGVDFAGDERRIMSIEWTNGGGRKHVQDSTWSSNQGCLRNVTLYTSDQIESSIVLKIEGVRDIDLSRVFTPGGQRNVICDAFPCGGSIYNTYCCYDDPEFEGLVGDPRVAATVGYVDMRGEGEVFWWEAVEFQPGTWASDIPSWFQSFSSYAGTYTLKSHRDGDIYSFTGGQGGI